MGKAMKTKSKMSNYIVSSIAAAVLLLTAQVTLAASATWLSSPQDSAWENANNWTPGGPPNGPSDVATFAQSSRRNVDISTSVEVNSIVFTSNSDSFGLFIPLPFSGRIAQLIISGIGVRNDNSVLQTFAAGEGGQIIFNNSATAASAQMRIVNFPQEGVDHAGQTIFNDTSSAAGASIGNGGSTYGAPPGQTIFNDTSTADHASISNGGVERVQIPVRAARQFLMAHQLRPTLPSTTRPVWTVTAATQYSTTHPLLVTQPSRTRTALMKYHQAA
jgi:hypothetical protein